MTPEYTKRGLLTVFFRQKYKFFVVFVLVCAAVAAYLVNAKPVYLASGALLIRFGSDANPDVTESRQGEMSETSNERREMIASDADLISSRDLLRTLVNKYGPEKIYPKEKDADTDTGKIQESPVELAVDKLQHGDLIVKTRETSDLIDITIFNADAALAADMARSLMDLFIDRQAQFNRKPQTAFLETQIKEASDKLAQSQDALRRYKSETGMTSIDDELQQLLKEKADARNVSLQTISDAESTLSDLQMKRRELLNTYREDSPAVQNVDASIRTAGAQMQARQNDLRLSSGGGSDASAPANDLVASHIVAINKRIAQLESDREKFNDLTRQVALDEENYKNYVTHGEEARITASMNEARITRVSIVDEPVAATKPARPRKLLVTAIGLLSAGVAGLLAVFAAEQMDDRFSNPRNVSEALDVPVLASFGRRRSRSY